MKLPGTYSGLSYDHSIQDHSKRMNSFGSSIISDQQTGQRLLDTAYINPDKPKQLFNYHDGNVIQFQLNRQEVWQPYIVDKNVNRVVGTNVLRTLRDDGLITFAKYNELLKM